MNRRIIIFLISAAFGLLIGCSRADPAMISQARPSAAATSEPLAGDPAQGQQVFTRGCTNCHAITTEARVGPGLAGLFQPGGPVLPTGVDYGGHLPNGQPMTVESVKAWIRNGGQGQIGVMPANGGIADLNDQDLNNLVAYLQTLTR